MVSFFMTKQHHYSLSHFEAGTTMCEWMSNSLPGALQGAITDPPWEGKANLAGRTT